MMHIDRLVNVKGFVRMTTAIVIAGGVGRRMGLPTPKQFLLVEGKPVIIYTLLNLQNTPEIDEIVIVVPEGWAEVLQPQIEEYGVTKATQIVIGGSCRQESVHNGILALKGRAKDDDVLCFLDANRPMVSPCLIQKNLAQLEHGDLSISLGISVDTIYLSTDGKNVDRQGDRSAIYRGLGLESTRFKDALAVSTRAKDEGVKDFPLTTLMLHYGYHVIASEGSVRSFKITTQEDLDMFRAYLLLDAQKASEIAEAERK